jgi:hypothetical protein
MKYFITFVFGISAMLCFGQLEFNFESSNAYPFGRYNPDAPGEVKDFEPMIGICNCKSVQRNPDGTWQDTLDMIWQFKYILNGTAVQDETWKADQMYATSIRQFHKDSQQWVVSYNSYPSVSTTSKVWLGKKVDDRIVLKQPFQAANGMDGFSVLQFYDMTTDGYRWKGEWIKDDQTVTYPFWYIDCKRE